MDWQRTSILAAIAVVLLLLVKQWIDFSERADQIPTTEAAEQASTPDSREAVDPVETPTIADSNTEQTGDFVPTVEAKPADTVASITPEANRDLITVTTDVMRMSIDPKGGDIVEVYLLDHYKDLEDKEPFQIMGNETNRYYIAQSGLVGKNGTDSDQGRPVFSADRDSYTLSESADSLFVDLNYRQDDTLITKRFTLKRGDHAIALEYIINNQSSSNWSGALFGQIKRDAHKPPKTGGGFGVTPFLGAAYTTEDDKYKKFDLDDLDKLAETEITGGWVAMVQHYFVGAWIPPQESVNRFTLKKRGEYHYLSFTTPEFTVPPGVKHSAKATLYVGPKNIDRLGELAPHLGLTVDYGWTWILAKPLFHVLDFIHGLIGSWGWSIVILTLLIKLLFFYPSAISYRSMAKMRKLQPMMADLKERFGDDRQKMSAELMKIYRKEKVNPMAGCLPILIQMPVFISLYWMLMESVELRHAPFLGYINDLSAMDPYFILPVLMGFTMWIQQKLNPAPPDPMQAKIMQMLPFVFTIMFLFFPAGLVVYWVVNNTLSIAQQYVITRQIEKAGTTS